MTGNDVPPGLRFAIRWTLVVGVGVSCLLLVLGIGLLAASGSESLHAAPQKVSLGSVPSEIAKGNGQGFLLLGVVVLLLTPIVRVLLSLATFAQARDIPFSMLTLFVIVMLSIGLALGLVP
jgi:uncharacterized membrane protein